jgi:hypothetical protein
MSSRSSASIDRPIQEEAKFDEPNNFESKVMSGHAFPRLRIESDITSREQGHLICLPQPCDIFTYVVKDSDNFMDSNMNISMETHLQFFSKLPEVKKGS